MAEIDPKLLHCPASGELCNYFHFCASKKELSEEGIDPYSSSADLDKLPESVREVVVGDAWCSEERLRALADIAMDSKPGSSENHLAVEIAGGITSSRSHFLHFPTTSDM